MKLVSATVPQSSMKKVKAALSDAGFDNTKYYDVHDRSLAKMSSDIFFGMQRMEGIIVESYVDVLVPHNQVGSVVNIFQNVVGQGDGKDKGKIVISSLDNMIELNGKASHQKFKPNNSSRVVDHLEELRL